MPVAAQSAARANLKLREASFATKKLLVQLNNSSNPAEIRDLLSQITGSEIDETVAVFTPLYINYGKNTKIGRNVFINFDCVFLDLGGITIEDNVLIAPKVSLLSEGHSLSPFERQSLIPGQIHIRKNAWIGAGTNILPGVTVGENSVVAAGAAPGCSKTLTAQMRNYGVVFVVDHHPSPNF